VTALPRAAERAAALDRLSGERVDVLVVGGGVTGTGVALDAASRGLSVALVEAHDLAHGTSRWSSKLVHGGLRYLASGDWDLVLESARERHHLMTRTAPHLVRPLTMVVPFSADVPRRDALLVRVGQQVAEGFKLAAGTRARHLPRPRHLDREQVLDLVPAVRRDGLRGGVAYSDGQLEDDARLVVALARTAAAHGATVLTRARVERLDGEGADVVDALTGERVRLSARHVVSCTGAWADRLAPEHRLAPSKGVHVVLPAAALGHPLAAVTVPVPGEANRWVFALPHPDGLVHVGLTDDPVDDVPDVPRAEDHEVAFLLDVLSRGLEVPLSRGDVVGSYAGVRPLLAGAEGRSADLSRRHAVVRGADGAWTVLGGKLTTYRRMAQDAVDRLTDVPCRTTRVPLVGAGPADVTGLPPAAAARLLRRYGAEAAAVAALADDPRDLQPLAPGVPVLPVELRFGVEAEGALTVDDLLERRTRLSLVDGWAEAARPAAEAALLAPRPA
jgi:glycerol-3-phosphate dehydrogenase